MRFGDLPPWAVELSALVREAICVGDVDASVGAGWMNEDEDACPLPSDLLWREPLFDQLIANRYKPGYLCPCWSHALRRRDCYSLSRVCMRDALQSRRCCLRYAKARGERMYKRSCLPEARLTCRDVRRCTVSLEAWDQPQARCSALEWDGAWAA